MVWEGEVQEEIESQSPKLNKVWKISVEFSLNKQNAKEIQFGQSEGSFHLINITQHFKKDT